PGHVIIDGRFAPGADGLAITGGNCTVMGLPIVKFAGAGILLAGPGVLLPGGDNTITGNWIGIDQTNAPGQGNGIGAMIRRSSNNVIGAQVQITDGKIASPANVISGNLGDGIQITNGGPLPDPV